MLPLIDQNLAGIAELCRRFGVQRLELFGSAAAGDFNPQTSDVDFFVRFADTHWKGSFKKYMGLKRELEELLGRPVDLVEPTAITNPYFRQVAEQHLTTIYAA